MMTKLKNWIRSKFHKGYTQPTKQEIKNFLNTWYEVPNFNDKKQIVRYYRITELYLIIDAYFKMTVDRKTCKDAFSELAYPIVTRKQYHHAQKYQAIALVQKMPIV